MNCYGLISGYVGVKSKHRYSSIAVLWIQVAFYVVVLSVVMHVALPKIVPAKEWVNGLCPVSLKLYWYYTAYFFISFLFPLVNRALHNAPRQEIVLSLTAIVILLSVNTVFFSSDIFSVNNGYTPLWLLLLYMIGGTIRLHGEKLNSYRWIRHHAPALFLLGTTAAWALKILGEGRSDGIRFLFGRTIPWDTLYKYNSPAIILSAVALFALFSGWKPGKAARRWIGVLAPTTFGVYLIHENPLVRWQLIKDTFIPFVQLRAYVLPFAVIGVAAAILAICAAIDLLRGKLFRLLKVRERCQWAFERIGLS
ncbi:MAG: acyltransferase family protein [Candidatus Ventricola sp.]